MTIEDRKRIDFLLQLGWTPVQIAREMGRSKSTIIREIVNRSVECDKGYRCSNRICALFDSCTRVKGYGGAPNRLFRCTAGCYEVCRESGAASGSRRPRASATDARTSSPAP